jgi:hypothetical protein
VGKNIPDLVGGGVRRGGDVCSAHNIAAIDADGFPQRKK